MMLENLDKQNESDLNQLLSASRNQVLNVIKNKVRNRDVAEDLLQDTFLEAHRSFHSFRQDSKFSTWLIGIAMNIIRNYYNRSPECRYDFVDNTVVNFDSDEVIHYKSQQAATEKSFITHEFLGQVLEKIEILPHDLRDIFVLIIYENLPYKDVAERLKTSVGNIKVKIFRIRAKLKAIFGENVFEEYC